MARKPSRPRKNTVRRNSGRKSDYRSARAALNLFAASGQSDGLLVREMTGNVEELLIPGGSVYGHSYPESYFHDARWRFVPYGPSSAAAYANLGRAETFTPREILAATSSPGTGTKAKEKVLLFQQPFPWPPYVGGAEIEGVGVLVSSNSARKNSGAPFVATTGLTLRQLAVADFLLTAARGAEIQDSAWASSWSLHSDQVSDVQLSQLARLVEHKGMVPLRDGEIISFAQQAWLRRNPRSTGYVAAKISANTARRNGKEAFLPSVIQFRSGKGRFAEVVTFSKAGSGHGGTGPYAIYAHPDPYTVDAILVGASREYGPMVVGFYDDETGMLVDESVREYDSLPVALYALASGAWYSSLPDSLIG